MKPHIDNLAPKCPRCESSGRVITASCYADKEWTCNTCCYDFSESPAAATANASETPGVIRVALISRHIDIDSEEDLKIRAWITAKASETLTLETLSALFDDWCKSAEFDLYEIDPTEPEKQRALRDAYGLIEESLNKGKALESELSTLRAELAKVTAERDEAKAAFYKAVENAGPCGACAECIACGSTMQEHIDCPIAERDAALAQLATAREALLKLAPRIRGELFESHPERIALEAALADMEAKDGSQ